jgi:hypothetical protein
MIETRNLQPAFSSHLSILKIPGTVAALTELIQHFYASQQIPSRSETAPEPVMISTKSPPRYVQCIRPFVEFAWLQQKPIQAAMPAGKTREERDKENKYHYGLFHLLWDDFLQLVCKIHQKDVESS